MDGLRDLYQDTILDHNKRPRNFRTQEEADRRAEGYNPLCGDQVTIYVKLAGDQLLDVSFQGHGCAISTASASLMTESLRGKTLAEAEDLFRRVHEMLTSEHEAPPAYARLGKLTVFAGVREFPLRVKCATLAWHTLHAALHQRADAPVSTE